MNKKGYEIGGKWRLTRDVFPLDFLSTDLFEPINGNNEVLIDGQIPPDEISDWHYKIRLFFSNTGDDK